MVTFLLGDWEADGFALLWEMIFEHKVVWSPATIIYVCWACSGCLSLWQLALTYAIAHWLGAAKIEQVGRNQHRDTWPDDGDAPGWLDLLSMLLARFHAFVFGLACWCAHGLASTGLPTDSALPLPTHLHSGSKIPSGWWINQIVRFGSVLFCSSQWMKQQWMNHKRDSNTAS